MTADELQASRVSGQRIGVDCDYSESMKEIVMKRGLFDPGASPGVEGKPGTLL
jgi:hypothetical protein